MRGLVGLNIASKHIDIDSYPVLEMYLGSFSAKD
jgi:hypothetical protein